MVIIGCDDTSNITNGNPSTDTTNIGGGTITNTITEPIKVKYVSVDNPRPNTNIEVLDSYSDGSYNYYVLNFGYVENVFVTSLHDPSIVYYGGVTPPNISIMQSEETTFEESVKETISKTFTNQNVQEVNVKVGVEAKLTSWLSASASSEWKSIWTTTDVQKIVKETNFKKMMTKAKSIMFDFSNIGKNGEPKGFYRYALFSVNDIYLFVRTSRDNKELKELDYIVSARDGLDYAALEYSPTLIGFNNSNSLADYDKISIYPSNFWESLPQPKNIITVTTTTTTTIKNSYSETRSINGDWDLMHIGEGLGSSKKSISEPPFEPILDIQKLKQLGYTKLQIDISFAYRAEEIWAGTLMLQILNYDNTELGRATFSHNNSWTRTSFSKTFEIDRMKNNTDGRFILLWSRVEESNLITWRPNFSVGNRTITITALK